MLYFCLSLTPGMYLKPVAGLTLRFSLPSPAKLTKAVFHFLPQPPLSYFAIFPVIQLVPGYAFFYIHGKFVLPSLLDVGSTSFHFFRSFLISTKCFLFLFLFFYTICCLAFHLLFLGGLYLKISVAVAKSKTHLVI